MTNDNDARGALTEAVERTIETIERQLSLIGERAPGEYLDKRPVVQSLQAHVRRLRTALVASSLPAGDGLTGWTEADAIIGRLMSSDPDFDDCADAAAFIRRMHDEHMRGPDGYETWKDAAIAERTKRLAGRVEDRVPYLPYLTDRADGVKGHYCITRWVPERKVVEHWNLRGHRWAACSDDVLTMEQAIEVMKRLEIPTARRVLAAPRQPGEMGAGVPKGFVVAPHYRGYARLGAGAYLLNHSKAGTPAELVISMATDEEKAGRVVGDERDNPDGYQVQPEAMAVRLRLENVAGLDALEQQLRHLRDVHFPASAHQDVPESWKGLMSFYNVDTPEAMVEAMEKHIIQLQATVLKRGGYGQQVETKVREG